MSKTIPGYNPPRQKVPVATGDPMEIELVFNVRPCGTCEFFWPADPAHQPYGPYPAYDFTSNTPKYNTAPAKAKSFPWVTGVTRPPAFPNAEIMDGCRKAPIMTIGINPNLTAFESDRTGTSWCYPNFTSDDGTDAWTKFAYYYRYRTVYQEHFAFEFVEKFLLKQGRIKAKKSGVIVSADRPSDKPSFDLVVRYDGDPENTTIPLQGELGQPRYVLLFDTAPPHNRFKKGDTIAARLNVDRTEPVKVFAEQIGYYEQFVPVLSRFQTFLQSKGHRSANLRMGEDVCQLDMVACASPHWGPQWLGVTTAAEELVVRNCVTKNAWALKQLVQTQPAVLFLVGESSWNMFRDAFGHLIHTTPPLPAKPDDGAFTLLRLTADSRHPCTLRYSAKIDGIDYELNTRLVISPHFSYDQYFVPQFRMTRDEWTAFQQRFAACAKFLQDDPRVQIAMPDTQDGEHFAISLKREAPQVLQEIAKKYASAHSTLMATYYDAHAMLAGVLEDLYGKGQLGFTNGKPGFLTRAPGPCTFCVNDRWKFPQGCPYEKPKEKQYPAGFLDKVARAIVAAGSRPPS